VAVQGATSAQIENLTPGIWYFEVAAINAANVESAFSSVASTAIQ
jgi:hypothetical protein